MERVRRIELPYAAWEARLDRFGAALEERRKGGDATKEE
jgi:hypothetical protein